MSSPKQNKPTDAQPELPIETTAAAAPPANGNGGAHIVTEETPAVAHRPFAPDKHELPLHRRVDKSFLEYASYVIRDRAIPNLADGLKPVQRRILWTLHRSDDGRFVKVANTVGDCMKYHPHGDASIGDALVVLANKRYLIEGQGNYGNIFTGDPAAAPRYIECRLTELARTELFNDEIKKLPFRCLPDFPTGGQMDAREYQDGKGSVKVRAKIKEKDESTVVIKELPPGTTTESLTNSIEDAVAKGKLKVKSINDFTSESVEIEIKAPAGVSAQQLTDALFAFTSCEVTINSRITVIREQRPVELTVSEVLRENTDQLVRLLQQELELKQQQLENELHFRTLERIFIEERIYKLIEKCKTNEAVLAAVFEGFQPFKPQLLRDLADTDVERLLQVRIRRISLFDINQHREEMEKTRAELAETQKHLKNVTKFAIAHLEALLAKYGPQYPRLTTKGSRHEEVDVKAVAFKSFKVAYDRATGYVGYKVNGDEFKLDCTKFDKLLLVFKDGTYKVTELAEKLFVGPELFYCGLPDRERVFTCAYTDRKASYLKRFTFGGTILNKAYLCIPDKSRILYFAADTPKVLYVRYKPALHQKVHQQTCDPAKIDVKSAKTRGRMLSIKDISSVTGEPTRGWDETAATTEIVFV